MAKPTKTTESKFTFDVLKAKGPVLVDFYATWCAQCRRLAPVLDDLAESWDGQVKIVTVDVEGNAHLADRYEIRKIPTLVLFEDGEEKVRLIEPTRRETVEAGLAPVLPQVLGPVDHPRDRAG